jgi:hypothetical protein
MIQFFKDNNIKKISGTFKNFITFDKNGNNYYLDGRDIDIFVTAYVFAQASDRKMSTVLSEFFHLIRKTQKSIDYFFERPYFKINVEEFDETVMYNYSYTLDGNNVVFFRPDLEKSDFMFQKKFSSDFDIPDYSRGTNIRRMIRISPPRELSFLSLREIMLRKTPLKNIDDDDYSTTEKIKIKMGEEIKKYDCAVAEEQTYGKPEIFYI